MTSILDGLFGSPTVGTPPYLPPGAIAPGMAPGVMAPSIFDPQAIDRQRTQDLLMGLANGFLKAGQPSRVPIDIGSALGQGIEGGLQAVQGSDQRSIQRAMMDAQIRNYQMQSALFPAALKSLGQTSTYDPYGGKAQPQPQPQITTQPLPAVAQTKADESGGNYTATNPTSGAYGAFQFTAPTWASVVQAHPELNLPLNMRQATPQQQDAAKAALDQDNGKGLQAAGIAPTAPNLYLAHRFGVQGTQTFLSAPDDAPVSSVLPADWIQQNPDLQGVTVGQFKAGVAQRYGGMPGTGPRADQGNGLPPIPIQPPDPSKYNALLLMGGPWAAIAKQKIAADQARYQAAKDLYTLTLQGQSAKREGANAAVNPDGSVNQSVVAANAAKTAADEAAKYNAHVSTILPPGWQNMQTDELRKHMSPLVMGTIDQLGKMDLAPSDLPNRFGGAQGPSKAELLATTKIFYPDYNIRTAENHKDFTNYMAPNGGGPRGGKGADVAMSIANASQHLADAADAYNQLSNGQIPAGNKWFNEVATRFGWDKATSFDTIKQAIGTEIAKVISAGSDNSVTEREANREILNSWNSPKQMAGVFQRFAGLIEKRRNTLYDQAKRAGYDNNFIDQSIGEHGTAALASLPTAIKVPQGQSPQAQPGAAPRLSPQDAMKLAPGTPFVGLDGIPRVRH